MKKTDNCKKISFWLGNDQCEQLANLAAQKNTNVSEVLREIVVNRLNVAATKSDIDFICQHMHDEIERVVTPKFDRLIKLLVKIGIMDVTMCQFNSKIIHALVPRKDRQGYEPIDPRNYDQMMRESKAESAYYLSNNKNSTADETVKEIKKNNPE